MMPASVVTTLVMWRKAKRREVLPLHSWYQNRDRSPASRTTIRLIRELLGCLPEAPRQSFQHSQQDCWFVAGDLQETLSR
jgi:hypothetical protein